MRGRVRGRVRARVRGRVRGRVKVAERILVDCVFYGVLVKLEIVGSVFGETDVGIGFVGLRRFFFEGLVGV